MKLQTSRKRGTSPEDLHHCGGLINGAISGGIMGLASGYINYCDKAEAGLLKAEAERTVAENKINLFNQRVQKVEVKLQTEVLKKSSALQELPGAQNRNKLYIDIIKANFMGRTYKDGGVGINGDGVDCSGMILGAAGFKNHEAWSTNDPRPFPGCYQICPPNETSLQTFAADLKYGDILRWDKIHAACYNGWINGDASLVEIFNEYYGVTTTYHVFREYWKAFGAPDVYRQYK